MNPKIFEKALRLPPLSLYALAALLCSCAATSVKNTWKSPEYNGRVTKVAVLTVDDRGLLRRGFENRWVTQLRNQGLTAISTFDLLSLPEINQDKPAAAQRLRAAGCEAVLVMR